MIGAYNALAATFYFLGDFESARVYAMHGVRIWRSRGVQSYAEDLYTPVVGCLIYGAICESYRGEIACCHAMMDEGI